MVTSVTNILKIVKSIEDEASKGQRSLEQTINAIIQQLKVNVCTYIYLRLFNIPQIHKHFV